MKQLKPGCVRYEYEPRRGCWAIYRVVYTENGAVGEKVDEKATKEEARAETYRLNGWDIKRQENNL